MAVFWDNVPRLKFYFSIVNFEWFFRFSFSLRTCIFCSERARFKQKNTCSKLVQSCTKLCTDTRITSDDFVLLPLSLFLDVFNTLVLCKLAQCTKS